MTRDWTIAKVSERSFGGLVPKRITLFPHLSLEELQARYRQANNPVERSHYQIMAIVSLSLATMLFFH